MTDCQSNSAARTLLEKADEILARAKKAHNQKRFAHAFELYGKAILLLDADWSTTHDVAIGKRLAFACREGSYPAFRKFYGRSTSERDDWGHCAVQRSQQAAKVEIELLAMGVLSHNERLDLMVHLQTLCAEFTNQCRYEEAFRWISTTYDTWRRFGDAAPLDERLTAVLKYYEARCYLHMRAYHHALTCVDEALRLATFEPPLLELAQTLRQQIVACQTPCR